MSEFPPGISVRDVPPQRPGQTSRSLAVNVPFPSNFKAAHRIIGKGGANIKKIQDCGVRCTVKALGAHDKENKEISGPFEVVMSSDDPANVENAEAVVVAMAEDLVSRMHDFVRASGRGGPHGGGGPRRGGGGGGGFDRRGGGGGGGGGFDRRGPPPPRFDDDRRGFGRDRDRDRSPPRYR